MANPFKQRLLRDEPVVVLNPDHPSPALTEFLGRLGIDGVFIDCEHGTASIQTVQDMCRAARAAGLQSIVRPEANLDHLLTRYLDAGAGGLIVPHVDDADGARNIVAAVRRARPQNHEDTVVVAMIESLEAVANLDAIVAVEGVDAFFMGPNDLSHSMGLNGQTHHPDVKRLVLDCAAKIRAAGKVPGTLVTRDTVAAFVRGGCRFLYEHANNFLITGANDFRHIMKESNT